MTREIDIAELRAKYPSPVREDPKRWFQPWAYCVGGALAKELGYEAYLPSDDTAGGMFPNAEFLGELLEEVNPNLTPDMALEFAQLVTRKNDTGNFETAWATLADALGYGKEGWTPADDESVAAFLREAHV